MNREPLVSVIINNYNYDRFIAEAIQSVLDQSYRKLEIIVVDDGSDDQSVSVIRAIQRNNPDRITLIQKENGGQASAFNRGFKASHGEIITFLDSDDYWFRDRIARVVEQHNRHAFVQHSLWCQNRLFRVLRHHGDMKFMLCHLGLVRNCVPTSALSFRKDSISNAFPLEEEPLRLCADAYLRNYAVYHHGVASIPDPLGVYRRHGENRWHDKMRFERTDIEKTILNLVNRKLIEENCAPIPENQNAVEQSFLESLDTHPNAKYLIFGTDSLARKLRSHLSKKGGQIVGYVHPDSGHRPSTLDSLPVHSAEELQTIRPSIDRIIIGTRFVESACNTLFDCGLSPDLDFLIPLDIEGRNDPIPKSASPIQDSVVLFGASECGKHAVGYLSKQYSIQCFSDNDPAKWGQMVDGIPVIPPNELRKYCNLPVIITSSYFKEIALQLNRIGFNQIWKSDSHGNVSPVNQIDTPYSSPENRDNEPFFHPKLNQSSTFGVHRPTGPHPKSLIIIQGIRRWAKQPTIDAAFWAQQKSIPYTILEEVPERDFDWDTVAAVYHPDGIANSSPWAIPMDKPVILDCPHNIPPNLDSTLFQRKIALRRAWGGRASISPELQVPYIHPCLTKPHAGPKSIVIIDLHDWLPVSCQLAFISILSDLNEAWDSISNDLGYPLRFYFTAGMIPSDYASIHSELVNRLEKRKANTLHIRDSLRLRGLTNIVNHTIPPQNDMDDHNRVFAQAMLLITDNGDFADQDIAKSISTNTGIWIVPRSTVSPISLLGSTIPNAISMIDSRFHDFTIHIQKKLIRPSGLRSFLRPEGFDYQASGYLNSLYLKSWDILWEWATIGTLFDPIGLAIENSPSPQWWNRLPL